jgi:hypothetical protein
MYFRSRSPAAGLLPLAAAPAWRKLLRWQVRGPTTSPRDKGMALNLEATPIALPQPPGLRRRAEPDGHVTCSVVVIRVPTPRAGAGLDLSSGVELLAAGVTSTGKQYSELCVGRFHIFFFFCYHKGLRADWLSKMSQELTFFNPFFSTASALLVIRLVGPK